MKGSSKSPCFLPRRPQAKDGRKRIEIGIGHAWKGIEHET